ncbi:MAG: YlmC/YmxH family sporulation protein [Firmicutes bacterium]|nr:YlmC/YmxH family sporulation protein [Bacillota bacterium]
MTMIKTSDLRRLDVVSSEEGRYLGSVCDVDLDPDTGRINAVIVDQLRPFSLFGRRSMDLEIPWRDIVLVGVDVVLVKNRTWKR